MTHFEQIKSMSLLELADNAVMFMSNLTPSGLSIHMSLLDGTVYTTRVDAVKHNVKWLTSETKNSQHASKIAETFKKPKHDSEDLQREFEKCYIPNIIKEGI